MRISIAFSLLILVIGATLGFRDQQWLVTVRTEHDTLVALAAGAGIILDAAHPDEGTRSTKHEREDKEAAARHAAADFIALAKELVAGEKDGGISDDDKQRKILAALDHMMSLDTSQLKTLIAEFRAAPDLDVEMRRNLIGFAFMTLANNQPQAALALFTESSDLFKESGMGTNVVSSSLTKLAKEDPMGALEWFRANSAKFPDMANDDTKRAMISGTASNDPRLAFSLIGELGIKDPSSSIKSIIDAASTPAERTATLAALRDHLATTLANDNVESRMAAIRLAQNAAKDGFEAGSKWIEGAGFTPEELESIGNGGSFYAFKSDDTGKWVHWLGENLAAGKSQDGIRDMVSNWTQKDYQAAGTWLASAPDGATKETSVRAYAETVSKYDPEIAAQWALTLPSGKSREQTLVTIYKNWPKTDDASRAAAAAFAKAHGIK